MLRFFQAWLRRDDDQGVGSQAERWAADWLRGERGFRIIGRNWRNPQDRREEIDLVGRDREVLVFVEVKARSARARVPGFYTINERKRRALFRAFRAYLATLRPAPRTFRFDVVEVTLPTKATSATTARDALAAGAAIRHYENVALFPKFFGT